MPLGPSGGENAGLTMVDLTIGSRVRKSPFFAATVEAGATAFTIYNHMFMPTSYGDPEREYELVTRAAAIWDVAAQRQVEIAGPDAFELTNYLTARDLTGCPVGRARYAPMCDQDGRLINDPVILRLADDRFWISIADSDILLWVRAIAGERNVDVTVSEPDASPLAIQGPRAMSVARKLLGPDTIDGLGFFHHRPADIDGIPMVVCRSGWSKQGGVELFLTDATQGSRLWDRVMEAGADEGIGPGTPNHTERIESGLLSYASDTDADTDPLEAGLGAFVSLDCDHDFVGRQRLLERRDHGARRRLVNVVFDDEVPVCENPWVARVADDEVGMLRNATWSPRLERFVGLALLVEAASMPGTVIEVDTEEWTIHATVTSTPFGEPL